MKLLTWVGVAVVLGAVVAGAKATDGPRVSRTNESLVVTLDGGVQLTYRLADDRFYGLQAAAVGGVELKSRTTCQFPLLAQEWGKDRVICSALALREAKAAGTGVEIVCDLLGASSEMGYRAFFLYTGASDTQLAPGGGQIHRDFYRFALTQQPEQACTVAALAKQAENLAADLKPVGTLRVHIAPDSRNIAGWRWNGWKQHYSVDLADGTKINNLRQLGTWEIDGKVDGLTVVNLRYRGLGRIEQPLSVDSAGGAQEAWSTTEILPGAVEGVPVISPAVPASTKVNDRGFALRHRAGAWIAHPARGAGVGFVDFQYRPHAALCSFYEKQGNLRAVSEVFPGDKCVSQTDEEWFALTDKHTTQDQVYLALVSKDRPLAVHEWRTRWQELDQYVRDLVSSELDFRQFEPLPGIGFLATAGTAGYYKGLAPAVIKDWHDMGVRLIASHSPGWLRGSTDFDAEGIPKPPQARGECSIDDWRPDRQQQEPWKAFIKSCATNGIAYYPWVGMTIIDGGRFVQRVGAAPQHWSRNAPGDKYGPGYEPIHIKGNVLDAGFRQAYVDALDATRRDYGYQGLWVDSFQNLFMSQLAWSDDSGNSMQRAWWEQFAAWSRSGVGLMAESHAFPGLSCSIEVSDWEKDYSYFPFVWKWHRGTSQNNYKPGELDRLCFRVMANKGWTAPDLSYRHDTKFSIPSFKRFAAEYLAALPTMRRPYLLPGDMGVLWLPFTGVQEGVWFSFQDQKVPAGVTASSILPSDAAAATIENSRTYRVKADDLLKAFSVRQGSEPDPRLGRKYQAPTCVWPEWTK